MNSRHLVFVTNCALHKTHFVHFNCTQLVITRKIMCCICSCVYIYVLYYTSYILCARMHSCMNNTGLQAHTHCTKASANFLVQWTPRHRNRRLTVRSSRALTDFVELLGSARLETIVGSSHSVAAHNSRRSAQARRELIAAPRVFGVRIGCSFEQTREMHWLLISVAQEATCECKARVCAKRWRGDVDEDVAKMCLR